MDSRVKVQYEDFLLRAINYTLGWFANNASFFFSFSFLDERQLQNYFNVINVIF